VTQKPDTASALGLWLGCLVVGAMLVFTCAGGLLNGAFLFGLFSRDVFLPAPCGWLQGAVGGGLFCGAAGLLSLLQLGVLWGLALRRRWSFYAGLALCGLYICLGALPAGLILGLALLMRDTRALLGDPHLEEGTSGI
jgi:hypothetical protein